MFATKSTMSQRFALGVFLAGRSARRPLLDLSVARVGRRWKPQWAPEQAWPQGSFLVGFVRPGCSRCERWADELIDLSEEFGIPLFLLSARREGVLGSKAHGEAGPGFPGAGDAVVAAIAARDFRRLAVTVPSAVLVADGVVRERWLREIPSGVRCVFRRWHGAPLSLADPS